MFSRLALSATACLTLVVSEPVIGQDTVQPASALDAALAAPTRTAANVARDKYRNPKETLTFFGVKPADTIVELWPGGGWYTEVLAPYLAPGGTLHVVPPAGSYDERIRAKVASDAVYGKVQVATFTAGQPTGIAAGSADVVLTFRNVHSWLDEDQPIADQVFAEAFRVLKPGGRLVYATCSILPEENEDVARGFAAAHPEFDPLSCREILATQRVALDCSEQLRLWPHRHGCDGFFAAAFERR